MKTRLMMQDADALSVTGQSKQSKQAAKQGFRIVLSDCFAASDCGWGRVVV